MCKMKQRSIYHGEGSNEQDHSARLTAKTLHSPIHTNNQMQETVENMLYRYNSSCGGHTLNSCNLESNVTTPLPAPSPEHVYEDLESSYASARHQRRVHYDRQTSQAVQVHVLYNSFREAGQSNVAHAHAHRQQSLPTVPEAEPVQESTGKPLPDSLWYRTVDESRSESLCDLPSQLHSCNDSSGQGQPCPYEEAPGPHLKSCSSEPHSKFTLCPSPSPSAAPTDISADPMPPQVVSRHSNGRQTRRPRSNYRSSLSTIPPHIECGLIAKRTVSDPYTTATDIHLAGAGTVFVNSCHSLSPFSDTSSEFSVPSVDYCDQPTFHACRHCKHPLPHHIPGGHDSSRRVADLVAHRLTYVQLEDEEGESNA